MPEIRIREHRNFIKTKSSEESAQKAANEQAAETAQENAAEIVRKYPHKPQPYAKQQPRISEGHPFAQGRSAFQQELRRKIAAQQRRTAVQISHMAGKTGAAILRAVKDAGSFLASIFGGAAFVAVVAVIVVLGAILASPLGILFSNNASQDAVPLSSAVSQINMELDARLRSLQSGNYVNIILRGAPPSWTDVIAVFAAYTAGAERGVDVVQLTRERVSQLRSVFWQMCYISSATKTVEFPDTNPDDDIDDSRTETTLTITVTGKTAETMRSHLGFTDFQNETLDILLSESAELSRMIGNTTISQQDALELLRSLPENLSPERRAVVEQALSLVGKVNYFWGGKSLTPGWDSRWGKLRKVTSQGSPTTDTYRPYGLDCSGFVDWVFYNTSGGKYVLSQGGGAAAQHRNCQPIPWSEAQPGDLVFYPNDDHIGVVGLRDSTGNLLIIHCASGQNNVVITDSSGFMTVGRPMYFTYIDANGKQ